MRDTLLPLPLSRTKVIPARIVYELAVATASVAEVSGVICAAVAVGTCRLSSCGPPIPAIPACGVRVVNG